MYTSFFGLSERPFAITPDPRYLYMSERHTEALAHLLYGVNETGGFVQLTGEVGTGKTTVVRTLLSRVPQHADVAVVLNPRITPAEFLLSICEELGVTVAEADRGSVKQLVDALNRRLLTAHAEGRRVILIVDEAQNLSAEVLEQVRLLTNLETPTQKLLQIILIGQPELREMLDRTELRQLAQRVTGRYHLSPLRLEETKGYVRHRMRVAGGSGEIFTAGALHEVYRLAKGIPRVINVCCDRALLGAYTRDTRKVTARLIRRAAAEVYGRRFAPRWLAWLAAAITGCVILGAVGATWQLWPKPLAPAPLAARPAAFSASAATATHTAALRVPHNAPAGSAAATTGGDLRTEPIDALLQSVGGAAGDANAYRRLLALWGVRLTADEDPCGQAAKSGLACLTLRGSWAEVRMLNRPAVLTLTDDAGGTHQVLLIAMNERFATLAFGARTERLPLDELSHDWFGQFTIVWKPQAGGVRQLSEGMSGADVGWLRRSLNALRGTADNPVRADLYDHELTAAVREFQRAHRLNVDGIAGIQTLVVLDAAVADPGSPLLRTATRRGG